MWVFICVFSQGVANCTLGADCFTANHAVKPSPLILRVSPVRSMLGHPRPLVELSLSPLALFSTVEVCGWRGANGRPRLVSLSRILGLSASDRPPLCTHPAALWDLMTHGCTMSQVSGALLPVSIGKRVDGDHLRGEHA